MISGTVNAYREAIIRLTVRGPLGHEQEIEAIIDTGFNGSFRSFAQGCIPAIITPEIFIRASLLVVGKWLLPFGGHIIPSNERMR